MSIKSVFLIVAKLRFIFKFGMIKVQMKDKAAFYFYGNWKPINGYLGEPQKTLQLLIEYLRKKNNKVQMLSDLSMVEKRNSNYKILIFGDLPTICLRTFFCLISGIGFGKIYFILFKEKISFSDMAYFFKNIDSPVKVKYLMNTQLLEVFLPQWLYEYLINIYRKKIFCIFFPTDIIDKSKILLCSCLEEDYLQRFTFSYNRNFDKKKIKLLYFGRDSYLRGVDIVRELNGTYKDYTFSSIGIFPFKGFLVQAELDSQYHIYHNNKNILEQVKQAAFTLFPFRTRLAGPDVPAALIESFLLGIPPIISSALLFDVLEQHNYPLVIDRISSGSVKKCIEENIKDGEDYKKIVDLCHTIRKDIVKKYSYNFSKLHV